MLKKILGILFSKTALIVLSLIVLFVLSALFWFYGSLFAFNDVYIFGKPYVRAIIIFIVWLTIFLFFLLRRIIEFIKNLKNPDKDKIKDIQKEADTFIYRMKRNFSLSIKDAKNTWRHLKLKKLPLIVIIGDEGAGKSTFINYANIEYPLSDSLESYKKLHQSTKNFSLYISKSGALVDTEGNYFTQESLFTPQSSDEMPEDDIEKNKNFILKKNIWKKFLHFLNKNPFYHKLSGIVLVIDTQLFLTQPKEYSTNIIRYLVKRINDIESGTSTRFPIYFVFSKLDLIDGMGDYLRIFSENIADNTLGVIFENPKSLDSALLHKKFSELYQSLQYYLISKNNLIHNLKSKNRAYLFLKQLDNLFALIVEFILLVKEENNLKNKSFIKGIYFVSAYQENIPINYLYDTICDKFSIKKPFAQALNNYTKQSYFVKFLLSNVIFKDFSASSAIKQLWKKLAIAILSIFALWITYSMSSFYIHKAQQENQIALENAKDLGIFLKKYDTYHTLSIEEKVKFIQNLRFILDKYPRLFTESNLMKYPFLDITYEAFEPAKKIYIESINKLLADTLIIELENILRTQKDENSLIRALYIYKALFNQQYLDKDLLKVWLLNNWELFKKYKIPQEDLLGCVDTIMLFESEENKQISLEASKRISQITRIRRLYALLEFSTYKNNIKSLYTLKEDIGFSFDENFENSPAFTFDSIYTKRGIGKLLTNINTHIDDTIRRETWLLEDVATNIIKDDDRMVLSIGIIKLYLQEYQLKWQNLLDNIKPKPFSTKEAGLNRLLTLSKKQNAINLLISAVSSNTNLNDPLLFKSAYEIGLPAAEIKNIFATLGNAFVGYHDIAKEDSLVSDLSQKVGLEDTSNLKTMEVINKDMLTLYTKLNEFLHVTQDKKEKINYALSEELPKDDPFMVLQNDLSLLPIELRKYYMLLSNNAWKLIEASAIADLNIAWSKEVHNSFINDIAPYYPFNLSSKNSLSMDSFKAFFGKTGTWNKFYEEYLRNMIIKKGSSYSINPMYASKLSLSVSFMRSIANIATLSNLMFDTNNNLAISYSIESVDLSPEFNYVTFGYDTMMRYDHTFSTKLDIVANHFKDSSILEFNATNHNNIMEFSKKYTGEWAWFKFLHDIERMGNTYSLIFNNNKQMYFDMRIRSNNNLDIIIKTLPNFTIPARITQ
ncbi:type VI secretion system membrane subunit TssM [Helicobacter didelphidarum]|uniref:Type VI secretion system membrane subunit TssM n=1 Tax=Helicobacter didelphidarum TaxID=2040648 RepID=A0A3D8IEG4_9HELI|nr:type VI secretion system membrane subunit TssM [Helicobacter didelphidarum]RDU62931.1 type VI secretion system membrane subunit TssM [Helicobacter didelphidarum]